MKPQYSHDVVSSFVMWLDNRLCTSGYAYVNVTGALYRQSVTGIPGNVYASPYKSWVWDSCTPGASIPSGFYNSSGQFLTRASGLVLDYVNGRVITPQNWGGQLTGVYARKEVNVYYSSTQESEYILEQVYNTNPNLAYPITGLRGDALTAPLIMVTNARGFNQEWALGGMDDSKNIIRCFAITRDNYLQDGVNSIMQDSAHSYIPYAPYSATPITSSGDLKSPPWSYCTGVADVYGCNNGLYIENVYDFKISDKVNRNVTFFLSVMDFDLSKPRFPRQ